MAVKVWNITTNAGFTELLANSTRPKSEFYWRLHPSQLIEIAHNNVIGYVDTILVAVVVANTHCMFIQEFYKISLTKVWGTKNGTHSKIGH